VPFGSAHGSEQDRVRAPRLVEHVGPDRNPVGIDRDAADQALVEIGGEPVSRYGTQGLDGLYGHLLADSVAWQDEDARLQRASFTARRCAAVAGSACGARACSR